ncbi:hypothetical protein DICPUDRAFT_81460 [Dictyostelium purpureum]|uniref:Calcium uniporter protein n=1 Tax=Dictyostelium purpureum TaxID=5786 RepID=F0ZTJ8_DICPU|nr:uncharacterized protein DICPUDRAFT_81460 [Dictyostelium purpureum]EGC32744.1 hypothetical protein DICPUDRAFT_81460 [Dictyostelium purpureum]|eukprot:XP_003290742.1 hypothetical protein DICPUDRAFT_81460 [Dictyostelium purpureum]
MNFVIRNTFLVGRNITTKPFLRSYSTQVLGNELSEILKQAKVAKLQERLSLDPRTKITFTEFEGICKDFGINESDIKTVSNALSQTGSIIYLPNSVNENLKTSVFLKPSHIYQSLEQVLDIENKGVGLHKLIEFKKSDIAELKKEIQPLQEKKDIIDRKSQRRATSLIWMGLGYCFAQAAVLARLTWWDLSWDVIEPVSYQVTFASVLIAYTYFAVTKTEFTYEALHNRLFSKRQEKLFRRYNFPKDQYFALASKLEKKEKELASLEAVENNHLHHHDKL